MVFSYKKSSQQLKCIEDTLDASVDIQWIFPKNIYI